MTYGSSSFVWVTNRLSTLPSWVTVEVWFDAKWARFRTWGRPCKDGEVLRRPDRTGLRTLNFLGENYTGIWKSKFFFNFYNERMIHFFSFLIDFEKASRVQIQSVLFFCFKSLWSHKIRRELLKTWFDHGLTTSSRHWFRPICPDRPNFTSGLLFFWRRF